MQVVAEDPRNWFLLEENGKLYLDVLVEHGAVSFNVTSELSGEQAQDYRLFGASSLSLLSGEMRHKGLMREWRSPATPPGWAERSIAAVHDWQKRLGE